MSWKQRLNLTDENEEAIDSIINPSIDAYLKSLGFYESRMSPRFFNSESYASQILDEKAVCLRFDTDDPSDTDPYSDSTMRIFINSKEVYMEVQNGYRSYERSYHMKIEKEEQLTVSDSDEILDIITAK